ncbi:hypothetical protein CEB3_c01480 [Peptococcaceae bacterium CEB3]|nr:hypothetical protein CEB3_c01480 [Peptococcaceae bacterium CEB3]
MAKKAHDSDTQEETSRIVELRVSSDGGDTWDRRKVNMGVDLEESGLRVGEIFKWQDEQYRVVSGEDGLRAEPVKKGARKSR